VLPPGPPPAEPPSAAEKDEAGKLLKIVRDWDKKVKKGKKGAGKWGKSETKALLKDGTLALIGKMRQTELTTEEAALWMLALTGAYQVRASEVAGAVKYAIDSKVNTIHITGEHLQDANLEELSTQLLKAGDLPFLELDLSGHASLSDIGKLGTFLSKLDHLETLDLTGTTYDPGAVIQTRFGKLARLQAAMDTTPGDKAAIAAYNTEAAQVGRLAIIKFREGLLWEKDRYLCDVVHGADTLGTLFDISQAVRGRTGTKRGKHATEDKDTYQKYDAKILQALLRKGLGQQKQKGLLESLAKSQPDAADGPIGKIVKLHEKLHDVTELEELANLLRQAHRLIHHVVHSLNTEEHGLLRLELGTLKTPEHAPLAEAVWPAYKNDPQLQAAEAGANAAVKASLASFAWTPGDERIIQDFVDSKTGYSKDWDIHAARFYHATDLLSIEHKKGEVVWEKAAEPAIARQQLAMWENVIGTKKVNIGEGAEFQSTTRIVFASQSGAAATAAGGAAAAGAAAAATTLDYYGFILYKLYDTTAKAGDEVHVLTRAGADFNDGPLEAAPILETDFNESLKGTLGVANLDTCVELSHIVDMGFGTQDDATKLYSGSGNVVRLIREIGVAHYYLGAATNFMDDTTLKGTVNAYAKCGFVNVQHDGKSLIGHKHSNYDHDAWEVPMVTTALILAEVVNKATATATIEAAAAI
jgi:hypothetical protein